jgi:hypothetical protein
VGRNTHPPFDFIEGRGSTFCRGCHSEKVFSGLDLGELPIANELLISSVGHLDKFPLHLKICTECGLGQVADVVSPDRIFRDYRYLSSMSTTFLQHASDFVDDMIQRGMFAADDWVLEIASNDGYLLRNFSALGIKTLGIEPAENVAEISRNLGIETISEFFSSKLAIELLEKYGHPKLIIANNVMAHVPDLIDFVRGLEILCGHQTLISIENPSLSNILLDMQFDTIYHEHYSYLSATAVTNICRLNNLHLSRVEELTIHGGSKRYWLKKASVDDFTDPSVTKTINFEMENGLFNEERWASYSSKVFSILSDLKNWLDMGKSDGKSIYGYGAAAKASTILNFSGIDPDLIIAIADVSLEKQQRFMPPHGIEIISPQELFAAEPTDILIFPWNIKSEIAKYLQSNLSNKTHLWVAIPKMQEIQT